MHAKTMMLMYEGLQERMPEKEDLDYSWIWVEKITRVITYLQRNNKYKEQKRV